METSSVVHYSAQEYPTEMEVSSAHGDDLPFSNHYQCALSKQHSFGLFMQEDCKFSPTDEPYDCDALEHFEVTPKMVELIDSNISRLTYSFMNLLDTHFKSENLIDVLPQLETELLDSTQVTHIQNAENKHAQLLSEILIKHKGFEIKAFSRLAEIIQVKNVTLASSMQQCILPFS